MATAQLLYNDVCMIPYKANHFKEATRQKNDVVFINIP